VTEKEQAIELLQGFPVIIEIPVAWGEMDALQHLNNVVYFRYLESVRVAYLDKMNFWQFMKQTGIGPILASTKCRFKIPLTYPDTVLVGAKTTEIKHDRFTMEHWVVSRNLQKVAAEGDSVLVSYNYRERRKTSMPEDLIRSILDLEGQHG
jgi:acyl-CoA thioester hydrolase